MAEWMGESEHDVGMGVAFTLRAPEWELGPFERRRRGGMV